MSSATPMLPSSSTSSTSTIRPRNRRLISIDDENNVESSVTSSLQFGGPCSPLPSPRPSRQSSPSNAKRPFRSSTSSNLTPSQGQTNALQGITGGLGHPSNDFGGILENSWTALQSLASTVLGSDASGASNGFDDPLRPSNAKRPNSRSTKHLTEWGPEPALADVGVGSKESRDTYIRAKRREYMLQADDHSLPDSTGRYKRRLSDDSLGGSSSVPPEENDKDELVYVYHVQPNDTLAGVILKFNCQATAFRKANRLWPNDKIQIREIVYLPVDVCSIKGKLITPVPERNLLDPTPDTEVSDPFLTSDSSTPTPTAQNSHTWPLSSNLASREVSTSSISKVTSFSEDLPYRHDSWILLPCHSEPIELARISRRNIGFFPPSRRKSVSYSDVDSPTGSLDIERPLFPSVTSSPSVMGKSRGRSGSTLLSERMLGPGGVGTLGKNVRAPGPAQDGLNKLVAAHIPSMLPSLQGPTLAGLRSGTSSARRSFDSEGSHTSGGTTGLDNVSMAIESWVRKMASSTKSILDVPHTSSKQTKEALGLLPGEGGGDLIELSDGIDGIDFSGEDRGRRIVASNGEASAREGQPQLLRERISTRGRAVESNNSSERQKAD